MRYEACYVHVMQVVKFLINPSAAEGEAGAVEREARMSIADRTQARKVLLQVMPLHAYFPTILLVWGSSTELRNKTCSGKSRQLRSQLRDLWHLLAYE